MSMIYEPTHPQTKTAVESLDRMDFHAGVKDRCAVIDRAIDEAIAAKARTGGHMDQNKEFQLLQLRNAIADKEWNIACANMETAKGGWTCDWHAGMQEAESRIQAITQLLAKFW